jgi:hypothetical protein
MNYVKLIITPHLGVWIRSNLLLMERSQWYAQLGVAFVFQVEEAFSDTSVQVFLVGL